MVEIMVADTKIVQRGLLLLLLVGVLAGTVLVIMLRRPGRAESTPAARTENLAPFLVVPPTGFPASLTWAALFQVGDAMPSTRGWEIRYTATQVLAVRGSSKIPLDILREMLDEGRQLRNFQVKLATGKTTADEGAAQQEVLVALKAVAAWHSHADAVKAVGPDNPDLQKLYQAVDKLKHSSSNVVRARAQETYLSLGKK
jgi:hypothetical protein